MRCGLAYLILIFWTSVPAVLLSGCGMVSGLIAWRRLQKPRSWLRTAELVAIGLPGIVGLAYLVFILFF